jgi:hypothetical protein
MIVMPFCAAADALSDCPETVSLDKMYHFPLLFASILLWIS